jgi:hypothetical protein
MTLPDNLKQLSREMQLISFLGLVGVASPPNVHLDCKIEYVSGDCLSMTVKETFNPSLGSSLPVYPSLRSTSATYTSAGNGTCT